MRTSEERVRELHLRMDRMTRKESHRRYLLRCGAVCAACLAAAILLALFISRLPIQSGGADTEYYTASIFADHGALGYVVTVFLAFCLGALVTVFCYRLKQRSEEENRETKDDREH